MAHSEKDPKVQMTEVLANRLAALPKDLLAQIGNALLYDPGDELYADEGAEKAITHKFGATSTGIITDGNITDTHQQSSLEPSDPRSS